MAFSNYGRFFLFALFATIPAALGHLPKHAQPVLKDRETKTSNVTIGSDPLQPVDTIGYGFHHTAFLVQDFDGIISWYRDVLGFRTIFRNEWDVYKVAYITYPSGGRNGTGYETGEQMFSTETNRDGIFEILWYEGHNRSSTITTLSHFGLVVPDIKALEKRVDSFSVQWLKRPYSTEVDERTAQYFGFSGTTVPEWFPIPDEYALFLDPEGNMIEAFPQH